MIGKPVRGTNKAGEPQITYVRTMKGSGQTQLRIGHRRGRGQTQIIDLDAAATARIVEQLGQAIAETVIRDAE
jgi:hypothetical protein